MNISRLYKTHKSALGNDRTFQIIDQVDQEFNGIEIFGKPSDREQIQTPNTRLIGDVAKRSTCCRRINTLKYFPKGFSKRLYEVLHDDLMDVCPDEVLAIDLGL